MDSADLVPSSRRPCPVIGILGGVGSGKSSVARQVSGAVVIDADRIGHELLGSQAVRDQIVGEFGESILTADGTIDRSQLAELVFGPDEDAHNHRETLENILHPEIRRVAEHQIRSVPTGTKCVIVDAALLLEAGWKDVCDAIVFVDTPLSVRQSRVAETRGWNSAELERRERSQMSLKEKRRHADLIVDNSASLIDAGSTLDSWLANLTWQTAGPEKTS